MRRASDGTGTTATRYARFVYHARPIHPTNVYSMQAALVFIAYHFGIRLFDSVDAYARRLLGAYIMEEMR